MRRRNMCFFNPRNKYGNKTCHCNQDHTHDSIFEAHYCNELALLIKAKEIKSYKIQVRYPLEVNGKLVTSHIVDFEVIDNGGKLQIHEVKGFATEVWNLKYKLFCAVYPDIEYIIVRK